MKKLLLCLFMVLIPICMDAQVSYNIKGVVCTQQNEPLPGANVKITDVKHKERITGCSTGADGDFSIPLVRGNYILEISFVGYTKYTTNVEIKGDVVLPPVALSEDAQLMDEVVVTARTITYNADGYVAEVYKNPLYKSMDMTSVLKMSPGTYATHNSVQVFGQGVSAVYLNGRKLNLSGEQLINYLETIDAKNVKAMEVIAATGVEEDASSKGKSIIKLTTINPETGGKVNIFIPRCKIRK